MKTRYAFRFRQQLADSNMQATAEEYKRNFAMISSYIKTLESINLDRDYEIIYRPEDYPEYVNCVNEAHTLISVFTGTTWTHITTVPQTVTNNLPMVNMYFQYALGYLKALTKHPNNIPSRASLKNMLEGLKMTIAPEIQMITYLIDDLTTCQGTLEDVAKQLLQIVNMAINDTRIDKEKVEALNTEIESLQQMIDTKSKEFVASVAGMGVSTLALEIIHLLPDTKRLNHKKAIKVLNGIFAGVFAISAISAVIDATEMLKGQERISQLTLTLNDYELDIAQLKQIAQDFLRYARNANALEPSLKQIYDVWNAFYADINAIVEGINNVENSNDNDQQYTTEYWNSITEEVLGLQADYQLFSDNMSLFVINDIEGREVELRIDMTQEEIKAALEAAKPVEIIEYLLS